MHSTKEGWRTHSQYVEDTDESQNDVSFLALRPVISVKTASGYTCVKHKKGGFQGVSVVKSDLLSDFYSDKPIKWRFLRLTRGLGVPIFTKIDAGGDKLETCLCPHYKPN